MMKNLWNNDDIDILIKMYEKYGAKYLCNILNRSESSIMNKAHSIGLKFKNIKPIYFEDNLKKIVSESINYSMCYDKLGVKRSGSNYLTLRKYIKLYDINIDHFETQYDRCKRRFTGIIPLSDILINRSNYNRTQLKKRLISNGLLEYKCDLCGNDGYYNNKKLTLQLDHINGVNNDNRMHNLRILCPNCHSQTHTYAGKNNSNVNNCICGSVILKYSKLCKKCAQKNQTDSQIQSHMNNRKVKDRPSLENLLIDVKELGYCATGRKYNVSDNCIRKWIKQYNK